MRVDGVEKNGAAGPDGPRLTNRDRLKNYLEDLRFQKAVKAGMESDVQFAIPEATKQRNSGSFKLDTNFNGEYQKGILGPVTVGNKNFYAYRLYYLMEKGSPEWENLAYLIGENLDGENKIFKGSINWTWQRGGKPMCNNPNFELIFHRGGLADVLTVLSEQGLKHLGFKQASLVTSSKDVASWFFLRKYFPLEEKESLRSFVHYLAGKPAGDGENFEQSLVLTKDL